MIDQHDRRIVQAVQVDGRAPFSRIAAVVGLSEQTVARRWRRLQADGVARVLGLRAPDPAGRDWFVRVRVQPAAADALADALARRPDVSWVSLVAGGAELLCSTRPASAEARDALLLQRLPRTARVLDITAHSVLHAWAGGPYEWDDFGGDLDADQLAVLRDDGPPPVRPGAAVAADPDDDRLVAALGRDGRASWAQLSHATGWSESRVARRVEALLAEGALYLDLDLSPEAMGFPVSAVLWLGVAPADISAVGEALGRAPETAYTAALTGPYALMTSANFRDTEDLYRFVTERVGALPVTSLETSPVLRRVKQAGTRVVGGRLSEIAVEPARG